MATKQRMHTAGLFADMSLDGPQIGTLVVIVDRAKNLPNRKTIGKQDPYCAARLGKEAKKTETDVRGGQTPRWDQELRFTVHDSPDYYQLKVSVFNDDKKTELIGETWVNLQDVIVPGGGQNDIWHSLNCRGRYAGDIRVEITYYDSRPKQEKAEKLRQPSEEPSTATREGLSGPRQPKPVKRRPLPADPTGSPAAANPPSVPTQEQAQIPPPRGYPQTYIPNQSPLQALEVNPYQTPAPQKHPRPQPGYGYPHNPAPRAPINATPPINQYHERAYDVAQDSFRPSPGQPYDDRRYDGRHQHPLAPTQPYEPAPTQPYETHPPAVPYDGQHSPAAYSRPAAYEYGSQDDRRAMSPGGPPPPPPAHRSTHNSPAAPLLASHDSYGFAHSPAAQSAPFESPQPISYQQSMPAQPMPTPAYTGQPQYQYYGSRQETQELHMGTDMGAPQQAPPERHHPSYASMQPSVEDAPPSPSPLVPRRISSGVPAGDARSDISSPAPFNLDARSSVVSSHSTISTAPSYQMSSGQSSVLSSATSHGDPSPYSGSFSRSSRYVQSPTSYEEQRRPSDNGLPDYSVPAVPSSLVGNMDMEMSREVMHQERGRPYQADRPRPSADAATYPPSYERDGRNSIGAANPRAVSPDTRMIPRKSVSPRPVPEERRLSGVPFGPDSYNALNPSMSSTALVSTTPYMTQDVEQSRIIMHDGSEVDPSDHLPRDSWAPEPEVKGPKYASQMPDQSPMRSRVPAPNSNQMPTGPIPTGRRQLRVAGRPHSMASSPQYVASSPAPDPMTPPARNRLQKKAHRASTAGPPTAPGSSPLAPISPYQDNSHGGYGARPVPRGHSVDPSGENYSPGGSPYNSSPGYRNGPPIPAKVPVGAGPPTMSDAWALLEEMKSIDLGSGGSARSRRRGY